MSKNVLVLNTVGIEEGDDGQWHNVFVDAFGKKHVDPKPTVSPFTPIQEQIKALSEELKNSELVVTWNNSDRR